MANKEKFKLLSIEELDKLSVDEKKEYKIKLKEYKKSLKPKKSKYTKNMGLFRIFTFIMIVVMVLGVLASIIYPLLYLNK